MADPTGDPWVIQLDEWIAGAKARSDYVVRAVAEDALNRVKQLTPVDTGYLRANWTLVAGTRVQPLAGDLGGSAASHRAEMSLSVVLQLKAGDTWTLLNPVGYAHRIEFGFVGEDSLGRHYDQKGAHMMQQTITEMPQIVKAAIARLDVQRPQP